MTSQSRKHRGYATQRMVAEWFAVRGWPFAESTGAGRQGVDVTGMPGLSVEVKAVPGDVTGSLAQAHRNRGGGLPFVAWRPNGYGPERISSWPVIIRLDDFTALLHAAGYGDALTEQGDVPDDGSDDDPWPTANGTRIVIDPAAPATGVAINLADSPFTNLTDPPQPRTIPCPGEPDCVLAASGHTHLEHP